MFLYFDAFLKDWNDILSECSLSLMCLIISQEALKLQELDKEIEATKSTVANLASEKSFKDQNEKMRAYKNKLEAMIMRIKKVKYQEI